MLRCDIQILHIVQKSLYELIGSLDRLEPVQRYGVHHSGVMGIESDDVIHSHLYQLLQSYGTVQRFPCRSLVLPALVQEWHDDGDAPCLSSHSRYDTLKILIMIIRRHMVLLAEHVVSHAVITDIHQKIQIHASHGLVYHTLAFAGSESRQ